MLTYQSLNKEDLTEEEILAILKNNHRISISMKYSIEELKKIKKITSEQPREIKKETPHSSLEEETESIFEDEIDYYLSPLNALERNVTESKTNQLLPSSKKHNYKKILFRLKLEFQKNIYEIKDFIETELDNLDNEDLTFFKQELLQEELKINVINQKLEKKDKHQIDHPSKNKLIFLPKSTEKIRILEDLKSIPREYYEGFLALLTSIQEGTFKNVKRFRAGNHKTGGLSEVRDISLGIRILYDGITPNTYVIISAFTKKVTNNKGSQEQLERKSSDYKSLRPILLANLENKEFRQYNEKKGQEVWSLLRGEKRKGSDQECKKKLLKK